MSLGTEEWSPLQLDRSWNAGWSPERGAEAVLDADEQVHRAKASLDHAIRCVEIATAIYVDALRWAVTVRGFAHGSGS